jgi:hypothetical protein
MHPILRIFIVMIIMTGLLSATVWAAEIDGTIKLGGVTLDEEAGDLSTMQEAFNIDEGFSVTQLRLNAKLSPRNYLTLNLREINLDSRKGEMREKTGASARASAPIDGSIYPPIIIIKRVRGIGLVFPPEWKASWETRSITRSRRVESRGRCCGAQGHFPWHTTSQIMRMI